jgi:hypothetical protein
MTSMLKTLKRLTRPVRGRVASAIYSAPPAGFDHRKAQRFELAHNAPSIRSDFPAFFAAVEKERSLAGLWNGPDDAWFQGDEALWLTFVAHVRPRRCLEIGCGPFGYLAPCYWIKQRTLIDPLIDEYRMLQLESCGATIYSGIETFAEQAENRIDSLVGAIDGAIICRNAIDHCEDPLSVLANISAYAAPGCYFLFWTDIWHLDGTDAGHRNITKSSTFMDMAIGGLGFRILKKSAEVRTDAQCIEYGCLAIK